MQFSVFLKTGLKKDKMVKISILIFLRVKVFIISLQILGIQLLN